MKTFKINANRKVTVNIYLLKGKVPVIKFITNGKTRIGLCLKVVCMYLVNLSDDIFITIPGKITEKQAKEYLLKYFPTMGEYIITEWAKIKRHTKKERGIKPAKQIFYSERKFDNLDFSKD